MDWLRFGSEEPGISDPFELDTDARPADQGPHRGASPDPERQRRKRLRRAALVLTLAGLVVAGSVAALAGRGGYLDLHSKRRVARELRAEVARLKIEVGALQHTVEELQDDPTAMERVAREQLGHILPDEVDFLLPRSRSNDLFEPRTPSGAAGAEVAP